MLLRSSVALICLVAWVTTNKEYFHGKVPKHTRWSAEKERQKQMDMLLVSAADVIHGTNNMVWQTSRIRQASDQCVSFEVGFVWKTMEDTYRKMIDIYNTTVTIGVTINNRAHISYLQKVEQLYFEIVHLRNAMHEIERKYKMDVIYNNSGMFENRGDGMFMWTAKAPARLTRTTWRPKTTRSWWFPIDYGWKKEYYWN